MSTLQTNNRPVREKSTRDLRHFGWIMAGFFTLFAALLRWRSGPEGILPPILIGTAALFMLLGTVAPSALRPIERGWMAFAERLSVVMTFVIMIALFYLVITPTGLLLRLFGKDLLARKIRKDLPSYWTPTEADGPSSRPYSPF